MGRTKRPPRTSADEAYDIICSKILRGELPPGSHLSRRKMASLTGVSVIPVIEALHRLEDEGLVESTPYGGSRVITLSKETLKDRFALREAVECQVARLLAARLTREQAEELRALAGDLDATSREPRVERVYWEKHHHFHLRMAEITGFKSLIDALHRISLFILLQRALSTRRAKPPRIEKDLHMKIVRGILSGDPLKAEAAMRSHVFDSGLIKRSEL